MLFLHSWVSVAAASGQSLVGRFEPVDCTGACCTKRHKIRETRLVLSEPVDPPWSLFFFRHVGILGAASHSTGWLFCLSQLQPAVRVQRASRSCPATEKMSCTCVFFSFVEA